MMIFYNLYCHKLFYRVLCEREHCLYEEWNQFSTVMDIFIRFGDMVNSRSTFCFSIVFWGTKISTFYSLLFKVYVQLLYLNYTGPIYRAVLYMTNEIFFYLKGLIWTSSHCSPPVALYFEFCSTLCPCSLS